MKKVFLLAITFCLLVSCTEKASIKDINKINGYWEISKVVLPSQEPKEYNISEVIDYIEVKNNIGYRKKVAPQFDGTFKVNNEKESIKILDSNSVIYIVYTTKTITWKEQLVELSDSLLVLKNKQNIKYYYKKHIPFSRK